MKKSKYLLLILLPLFFSSSCVVLAIGLLGKHPDKAATKNLIKNSPWNVSSLRVSCKGYSGELLSDTSFTNAGSFSFMEDEDNYLQPGSFERADKVNIPFHWVVEWDEEDEFAFLQLYPDSHGGVEVGSGFIDQPKADLMLISGHQTSSGNLLGLAFPWAAALRTSATHAAYECEWQIQNTP